MQKIRLSANFAAFVIFFGVALLEAFRNRNWLLSLFWVVVAFFFILGDNVNSGGRTGDHSTESADTR